MPPLPVRRALARALPLLAVIALAGCASRSHPVGAELARPRGGASSAPTDDAAIAHFLNRVTFGARPEDIDAVRRIGAAGVLDRQLHPETIDDGDLDARLAAFETLRLPSRAIAEQYLQPAQEARRRRQLENATAKAVANAASSASTTTATPSVGAELARPPRDLARPPQADQELFRRERLVMEELSQQKVLRAIYSRRQLQEVLVDFWFNHFNVFAGKGADRALVTAYERDTIRPHVFGRFRDLLAATAESPAMLFFLDNWVSAAPFDGTGLRTRPAASRPAPAPGGQAVTGRLAPGSSPRRRSGLNENYARELMELHTLGVDGGYTQKDVVEVARCFTGWTIAQPRDGGGFRFDPRRHDGGQKVVLGHVIKAGGGKDDGDRVLDILARDPHTARFIAAKLVRRFVSDDPPPALVDRIARRFRETDGDLREVYRAIILSPEFWSPRAYASKFRTPFEFVVAALRTTAATVESAAPAVQTLRALGMPPYLCQPPTGYPDRADAWVNTGAMLNRVNFALALADNRLPGIRVDVPDPRALALALGGPEFQRK